MTDNSISNPWIRCSERLPVKNDLYETTQIYGSNRLVIKAKFFPDEGSWKIRNDYEMYETITRHVIAWREIVEPEPYEGEP